MKTKLLLIEDEPDLADNIKNILELNEFDVTTARDGEEGIKLAAQIVPDIIISDILMPKKTGYEVLEQLSKDEKTSHIPFIFLTAKVEQRDLRKGMELGADDYLFKPFHSRELLSAIKARLKRVSSFKTKSIKTKDEKGNRYTQDDNIILSINQNTNILKVNKINYIIAERQYSKVIITDGKSVLLRKSLLYWESILPTNLFIRIHRNTIVNVQEVKSISKKTDGNYKAIMKSGKIEFEISRRYMKKIRDLFLV